jgi:hypothetical protein
LFSVKSGEKLVNQGRRAFWGWGSTLFLVLGWVYPRDGWGEGEPIEVSQESTSVYESIAKSAVINFNGLYRGAALSDLGNSRQPGPPGQVDPNSPLSMVEFAHGGYKVRPDLITGLVAHFFYFPVGNPVGTGQDIQMLDPMLLLQKNNLVNSGGFSLHGKCTLYLPLTNADTLRQEKLLTALSPILTATYEVPHTELTLAAYSYLRVYVPGTATESSAPDYRFYFAPNLSYQLSKEVAATLWVDLLTATHPRSSPLFAGVATDRVDFQPGFSWNISKSINLNPVLNIYPAHPTLASTSIQAYLSARAF